MGDIRPLGVPGWENFSTWGYDSGTGSFYAQLTHNSSSDDNGPDVWITAGTGPVVASADALAELIAQAVDEPVGVVRSAMQLT